MGRSFMSYVDSNGVYAGPKKWVSKKDITTARTLTSLGSLEEIVTTVTITVIKAPMFVSLGNFRTTKGSVFLEDLLCLQSLGSLTGISRELHIQRCPKLKNLGRLKTVAENCALRLCPELESLGNLSSTEKLHLIDCPKIKDLGRLTEIKEYFRVTGNSGLKNLGALTSTGHTILAYCEALETLEPLVSVTKGLSLWENNKLSTLGSLVSVEKKVALKENPNLLSLGHLKSIGEDLNIGESSIKNYGDLEVIGANLQLNPGQSPPRNVIVGGKLEYRLDGVLIDMVNAREYYYKIKKIDRALLSDLPLLRCHVSCVYQRYIDNRMKGVDQG